MNETLVTKSWKLNSIRTGPRGESPVVLVHPVGLDLTYRDAQIEALRNHYDVVAFDLPGRGSSPGVPNDWTIPNAVSFLDQIIESTGSPKVHLIGLSVGGIISQAYALAKPGRLRSLTLIDTASTFSEQGRQAMRKRAVNARTKGMQSVIQEALDRWFMEATNRAAPT